jgi:hypothetical protein
VTGQRWVVLGEQPASTGAEQPFLGSGVPGYVQAEFDALELARGFCWDQRQRLGPLWVVDRRSEDGLGVEIVYGTG